MTKVYDLTEVCVLIAEDNDFMAGLLTSVLAALRVGRVLRAKCGAEAIELLEAQSVGGAPSGGSGIDLIMSDWLMAPVDGMQLLQWVRSHPQDHIRFLPFIMLTAFPEAKRIIAARDAGNTEFLRKPVSVADILNRLVEVIERPRPFVRTDSYFGPDRRRHGSSYDGPERRSTRDRAEFFTSNPAARKALAG